MTEASTNKRVAPNRSRKHLLGQQSSHKKPEVKRRLSVRVPEQLAKLVEDAVAESGDSRNKWVSDALERFRKKQVLDRLSLEPVESAETEGMSPEELEAHHIRSIDNGLWILVRDTMVINQGGASLQILLNDEGLYAMQDLLARILNVMDNQASTRGHKTILANIALWDRVMENKTIPDIAKIAAKHKTTRSRSKSSKSRSRSK